MNLIVGFQTLSGLYMVMSVMVFLLLTGKWQPEPEVNKIYYVKNCHAHSDQVCGDQSTYVDNSVNLSILCCVNCW